MKKGNKTLIYTRCKDQIDNGKSFYDEPNTYYED
jgi:hypothetical protein